MRETLEQLKAIRDDAVKHTNPTHLQTIESDNQYFESNGYGFWCCQTGDLVDGENLINVRSLSDIERQIELLELIDDIRALGFLEESHDSGVSHRNVCKRAKELIG